jgi:hypothetical protein
MQRINHGWGMSGGGQARRDGAAGGLFGFLERKSTRVFHALALRESNYFAFSAYNYKEENRKDKEIERTEKRPSTCRTRLTGNDLYPGKE